MELLKKRVEELNSGTIEFDFTKLRIGDGE
jgi:hypothetical protein